TCGTARSVTRCVAGAMTYLLLWEGSGPGHGRTRETAPTPKACRRERPEFATVERGSARHAGPPSYAPGARTEHTTVPTLRAPDVEQTQSGTPPRYSAPFNRVKPCSGSPSRRELLTFHPSRRFRL